MSYQEKTISSGAVLEILQGRTRWLKGRIRNPKARESSIKQQELNWKNSWKKLIRILNANFVPGDLLITLSYQKEPSEEDGEKQLAKFMRRLRKYTKQTTGEALRYVSVTEVDDEHRLHHHLICQSMYITPALLLELWDWRGRIDIGTLDGDPMYNWLAAYFVKQERNCKYKKGWNQSRNIVPPTESEPKKISERKLDAQPKLPKGYLLVDYWTYADSYGNKYRYIMAIKQERRRYLPDEMQQHIEKLEEQRAKREKPRNLANKKTT